MRVYCYQDGVIHFTTGEVPEGALCFAAHEDAGRLKSVIAMTADVHSNERMLVVPGFGIEPDSDVGLRLLIKYSRGIKDELQASEEGA